MNYPNVIHPRPNITLVSLLTIDADSSAERLQIFNRENGEILVHRKVKSNKLNIFLPLFYSSNSNLMCVILDDIGEYNAAIEDRVKPIPVDLVSLDIDNPMPYEL